MRNDQILDRITDIADEIEVMISEEYVLHSSCLKASCLESEMLKWLYTGTRISISGDCDLVFVAGSSAMTGTKNQMLSHQFTDLCFLLWCTIEDMNPLHVEDRQVFEDVINK